MFLKSLINPHFLFNILINANILIYDEPGTALRILLKLDKLITYQMRTVRSNIKRLLDLLYGDKHRLKVMQTERLYKVELEILYF